MATVEAELDGTAQTVQINVAEQNISIVLNATRRGDAVTLSRIPRAGGAGTVMRGSGELTLTGAAVCSSTRRSIDLDPAAFGDYPQAAITGSLNASGALMPRWSANVALALANSLFGGVPVEGEAKGEIIGATRTRFENQSGCRGQHVQANGSYGQTATCSLFRSVRRTCRSSIRPDRARSPPMAR